MTFDLNSTVQELQVHYKSCWSMSTLASGHITVLLSMYLSILSDFYESINCLRHWAAFCKNKSSFKWQTTRQN